MSWSRRDTASFKAKTSTAQKPGFSKPCPAVEEVTAQAILDYRSENGPFKRIEDLLKVSGIGPATFENIKDCITVSD
ncbi:MAG: helix-hairpin-helix domain-containing protein [Dehalococcoidia bacterium]